LGPLFSSKLRRSWDVFEPLDLKFAFCEPFLRPRRRLSYYQLDRKLNDLGSAFFSIPELLQHQLYCTSTERLLRIANRGQRYFSVSGKLYIIIANDRQILGHLEPRIEQLGYGANCGSVVVHDRSRWTRSRFHQALDPAVACDVVEDFRSRR
jgi:hypothetical protein